MENMNFYLDEHGDTVRMEFSNAVAFEINRFVISKIAKVKVLKL